MKSKTPIILFSCLTLIVCYLTSVQAVTDTELEALEKQIEQQEADERRKVEAAEERKAEAEAKRKEEQKRKVERTVEAEEKRKADEEAKRKAEEARLAEIEQQRQEEENKKKVEEAKQEKLQALMEEAKSAESSNDYELAITKYNNILSEDSNNFEAKSNIERIKSILDNCKSIIGEWNWFNGASMIYREDGTFVWHLLISGGGTWKCINPENYEFYMTFSGSPQWDGPIWVIENEQKLRREKNTWKGTDIYGVRPNLKLEQKETFKGL